MNPVNYVLEKIDWLDSAYATGWIDIDVAVNKTKKCLRCTSVGWVLHETDDFVLIGPHVAETDLESPDHADSAEGLMWIPKVSITARMRLTEGTRVIYKRD